MKDPRKVAFRNGKTAFKQGEDIDQNDYGSELDHFEMLFDEWEKGWLAAQKQEKAKLSRRRKNEN